MLMAKPNYSFEKRQKEIAKKKKKEEKRLKKLSQKSEQVQADDNLEAGVPQAPQDNNSWHQTTSFITFRRPDGELAGETF